MEEEPDESGGNLRAGRRAFEASESVSAPGPNALLTPNTTILTRRGGSPFVSRRWVATSVPRPGAFQRARGIYLCPNRRLGREPDFVPRAPYLRDLGDPRDRDREGGGRQGDSVPPRGSARNRTHHLSEG